MSGIRAHILGWFGLEFPVQRVQRQPALLTFRVVTRIALRADEAAKNEITLEFDQPMIWKEECKAWIELDGKAAPVRAGQVAGHAITLQLSAPSSAKAIGYISGRSWDGKPDRLLYGANGVAALAFSAVPLAPSAASDAQHSR